MGMILSKHGLLYGTVLGILASAILLGSAYLNPESMVDGYPPDIQAKHGQMGQRARRHKRWVALPYGVLLIGGIALSLVRLGAALGDQMTFLAAFANTALILLLLNLVDLVVLDWPILNTIQPCFIVLPGTEGMAGYRNYGFHFRKFQRGTVGSLVISFIAAVLALVFTLARV